jgi:IS4 transposase
MKDGEIVIWDKAYNEFAHLYDLNTRGIFWVNRAKDNIAYEVIREVNAPHGKIIRDVSIRLTGQNTALEYPEEIRLVEAWVEVKGEEVKMTFITNNFEWATSSICALYKARWGIEVFFKQIKQNLQIADFLGHNENAVRWQIWMAMLAYVLLRFIQYMSKWKKPFSRLFTLLRGVMWSCLDLSSLVKSYGTAGVRLRMCGAPEQAYLPGFSP